MLSLKNKSDFGKKKVFNVKLSCQYPSLSIMAGIGQSMHLIGIDHTMLKNGNDLNNNVTHKLFNKC